MSTVRTLTFVHDVTLSGHRSPVPIFSVDNELPEFLFKSLRLGPAYDGARLNGSSLPRRTSPVKHAT